MITSKQTFLYPIITFLAMALTLPVHSQTPAPVTTVSQALQTTSTTTGTASLSDGIATVLAEVNAAKAEDPDSEQLVNAEELLKQASEQLQLRDRYTSETRENKRIAREAPAALEMVKEQLKKDEQATTTTDDLPSTATTAYAEQALNAANAELANFEAMRLKISDEISRKPARLEAIPKELVAARQDAAQAEVAASATPETEDPLVSKARELLTQARVKATTARIESLESEQKRYSAREELLPLANQLLMQKVAATQAKIKSITDKLADFRKTEAKETTRELKKATRDALTSNPIIQAAVAENTSITAEFNLGALVEQHDQAVNQLQITQDQTEKIKSQYSSLTKKFDTSSYSDSLGVLLQKMRKEVPDIRSHRESIEQRSKLLANANLKFLEVQDMLDKLADPDSRATKEAKLHNLDPATKAGKSVVVELTDLLKARREYLSKLRAGYDRYFTTLVDLNASEQELVRQASAYSEFIDERILWLPSSDPISINGISKAVVTIASMVQPSYWFAYGNSYLHQAKKAPIVIGLGAIILMLIIFYHARWKVKLRAVLEVASKNRLIAFKPVIQSLYFGALYVMPLAAVMLAIGLPIANLLRVPIEIAGLANGLIEGAAMLFLYRLAQIIVQRKGIAEVFFAWPDSSLGKLRRALSVYAWLYIPSIILIRAWETNGTDAGSMEAARVLLIILLVSSSAMAAWLLYPKTSALRGINLYKKGTIFYRLRYPIVAVIVVIPFLLAVGAGMGYVYTAVELSRRLNTSFWLGSTLLMISEISYFWILVKRRRLAIDEAKKRRDAARALQAESENQSANDIQLPPIDLDIAAISKQAGRLINVLMAFVFVLGLWGVWASVLPALHYLDSHGLWNVTRNVPHVLDDGTVQNVSKIVPVSVTDLLLVLLVIIGIVGALRNFAGLLDITVYQRLAIQPGERYASNTLIRYIIITIGAAYIFHLLGLQWAQVQWLVAGVSVGLGFGMQEIFANFVSGLILLFERPIRVGDIVTVNDMTGKVSQIRIRATTVINWDHKEHIIPNKELITKSVLNWTLSDKRARLMLGVGVAYGTDYDKARDILLKIAKENEIVLDDPAPAAVLEKFSPNSVDFILFAHLPNMDNFLGVRHDLVSNIEREFRAAGINIPFPQMDVRFHKSHPIP